MKAKNVLFKIVFNLATFTGVAVFLLGCQPDNPPPNNNSNNSGSLTLKWNLTIDGQNYSYSVDYPNNSGAGSLYSISGNNGQITLAKEYPATEFLMISKVGMTNTGNYTLTSSNVGADNSISFNQDFQMGYSNSYGGSTNVEITSFSPNSVASAGSSGAGLVKGTITGTIGRATGGVANISGSFEALRNN
jgi:hypothetical protein